MSVARETSPRWRDCFCCPAPRLLGGTCRRFVALGYTLCRQHEGCDPDRRCDASLRGGGTCQAWAIREKARCVTHDPETKERVPRKTGRTEAALPQLLTHRETMRLLKVSRATLFRLLRAGLPSMGTGRLRRFDREAVCAWWRQRDQPAAGRRDPEAPKAAKIVTPPTTDNGDLPDRAGQEDIEAPERAAGRWAYIEGQADEPEEPAEHVNPWL